jgi:hypothetical protein
MEERKMCVGMTAKSQLPLRLHDALDFFATFLMPTRALKDKLCCSFQYKFMKCRWNDVWGEIESEIMISVMEIYYSRGSEWVSVGEAWKAPSCERQYVPFVVSDWWRRGNPLNLFRIAFYCCAHTHTHTGDRNKETILLIFNRNVLWWCVVVWIFQ